METIHKLYEQKRSIFEQAEAIKDLAVKEERALNADEKERFEKAFKDMEEIDATIKNFEALETKRTGNDPFLGKDTNTDAGTSKEERWGASFDKYLRFGMGKLTDEERSSLKFGESAEGIPGVVIDVRDSINTKIAGKPEKRASNSVITNGAYLHPLDVADQFATTMKAIGPWMEACTILNSAKGNTMYLPYYDDAGNDGAQESEGTDAIASSVDLDSARVQLDSYWTSSTGIKVGWSDLRDADYPVNDFVIQPLMDRLLRAMSTKGTVGTGSSQPEGITAPSSAMKEEYVSKGAVPDMDDFTAILKLVNYAYHTGPSSGWMFNSNTMFDIASAVKSATYNNEPLWQPALAQGVPDTLFGYKYWINNSMVDQSAAPGNFALFGDYSKFILRFAGPLIISRLEERYAETGKVGFLVSQYFDSVWRLPVTSTYTPVAKFRSITT